MKRLRFAGVVSLVLLCGLPSAAMAHVKWFAPYIIDAPPEKASHSASYRHPK